MRASFVGKRLVKPSAYGPPERGNFALDLADTMTVTWDKCREQFAARFNDQCPGLFFCHDTNAGDRPASFLVHTEEILDITPKYQYSTFSETDRQNVTWIEPSRFWMSSEMRRQLLTILLRAGLNYDPAINNYEDALWKPDGIGNNYAAKTRTAVTRFLYGFTEFCPDDRIPASIWGSFNNKVGWVSLFEGKDEREIRNRLVLPADEPASPCIIGLGKLWG